jgi:hypothetical protein
VSNKLLPNRARIYIATETVRMTTSEAMKLVDAVQGTSLAALWHGINLHQGRESVQTSTVALGLFEPEDRRRAHHPDAPTDE